MNQARWTRVAYWGVPALLALLLAVPGVALPGDRLGIRRFQTPPLGEDLRLGQTFTMPGDGLRAIEVFPVAAGEVSGDVRLELYEIGAGGERVLVRTQEVRAEDFVGARSYRFEFPPIVNSSDRTYSLDFVAAPGGGVAFWATRGERYTGGSMHANGHARWADLAFRVDAPAPSVWAQLMALRDAHPARAYLAIAAAAAIWLLLGLALRTLEGIAPELAPTDSSQTA